MSGVVNVKRRTFDVPAPAAAKPELPQDLDVVETSFGTFKRADVDAHGPSGTNRAFLDISHARARLDLDSRVGKFEKVEGGARKAGWECTECDMVFHDSDALLEHLNSRLHLGKLGYSMRIEKSSASAVKSRLARLAEKAAAAAPQSDALGDSLDARLREAEEQAEARKRAKKESKRLKKQARTAAADEGEAADVAALLGFGAFGGSKE